MLMSCDMNGTEPASTFSHITPLKNKEARTGRASQVFHLVEPGGFEPPVYP